MESEATGTIPRAAVLEAFQELKEAVVAREAEYGRQARYRWRFGVALAGLVLLGMLAAMLVARGFDRQVFTSNLMEHLQGRAPEITDRLKRALATLGPVYRAEVQRTLPAFQKALGDAINAEAAILGETLSPLVLQDPSALARDADAKLAQALAQAFPDVLGKDEAKARALAAQLRARQLAPWPAGKPGDLGAPFVVLRQIQEHLRGMGPPDEDSLVRGDLADALWRTAFDVVKAKISTGDVLGLDKAPGRAEGKPAQASAGKGM